MSSAPDLPRLERACQEREVSIAALCRRAEISQTTWMRWKRRLMKPTQRKWDRVVRAANDLGVRTDAA